jgi:hypothetical protein
VTKSPSHRTLPALAGFTNDYSLTTRRGDVQAVELRPGGGRSGASAPTGGSSGAPLSAGSASPSSVRRASGDCHLSTLGFDFWTPPSCGSATTATTFLCAPALPDRTGDGLTCSCASAHERVGRGRSVPSCSRTGELPDDSHQAHGGGGQRDMGVRPGCRRRRVPQITRARAQRRTGSTPCRDRGGERRGWQLRHGIRTTSALANAVWSTYDEAQWTSFSITELR